MNTLKHLARFSVRVLSAFSKNRGILLAGGVGYNALLSLVPFVTLAVATLSLFVDEARILGLLRRELAMLVPQHADTVLETAEAFLHNQATAGLVSVLVLLFFSSIAFRMLEQAMDAIFHTQRARAAGPRKFWVSALLPYLFMLFLMVALLFITLLTSGVEALADRTVRLFGAELSIASGMAALLSFGGFIGLVALFTSVYRVLPVVRVSFRRALIGGLCAALIWRVVGAGMVYYFTYISMVNVLYGSLATVIVVLLYLEIAFIILLLGAQVIAELEASAAAGLRWYEMPNHSKIGGLP